MNLDFRFVGENLIVKLRGDIDEFSARVLRSEIDRLIDAPNIRSMTLDMGEVTFIDSTGLGLVLGRYKKLQARHAELLLKNVPTHVDKVFRTSGVYSFVPKID